MRMRLRTTRPNTYRSKAPHRSLTHLANELSQSINRVRQAYGSTPMSTVAERLEIKQAEEYIERSADRLLKGELDRLSWHQALGQYEQTWLMLLDEILGNATAGNTTANNATAGNTTAGNTTAGNTTANNAKNRHAA